LGAELRYSFTQWFRTRQPQEEFGGLSFTLFYNYSLYGCFQFILAEAQMLRVISLKAFVVSNIAHWIIFITGWIAAILLYCAGATIASEGTASFESVLDQAKSSPGLLAATTLIFFIAPIPAGYIAAKIAPDAKLLNGVLSTSVWFAFCAIRAIWGSRGDHDAQLPHWLAVLTNYGIPIPALLGAYIWQMRADRGSFGAASIRHEMFAGAQRRETPAQIPPAPRTRRLGRTGTGLGIFIFLLLQLLLTGHERNVLFVSIIAVLALIVLVALVSKVIKSMRPSA
jgi:hypothetical protein